MNRFDLVVRGGTVVTAADTFRADVGIRGGAIAALARDLDAGTPRDGLHPRVHGGGEVAGPM